MRPTPRRRCRCVIALRHRARTGCPIHARSRCAQDGETPLHLICGNVAANLEMVKIVYYMDKDAKEAEEKKKVLAAFLKKETKVITF